MPGAVLSNGAPPAAAYSDEDVVLTGLSGRLPESNSIEEFADQLFAGVDLVTADDRRWPTGDFSYFVFFQLAFSQGHFVTFATAVC
ncbi:Fatty acid synthase [Eumeta japonica]|uniref:Fatty acid synthase n=1 Tax=Eumeta variegata TaxID=151549 RepID=A0A4C1TPC9_EUMVA|nr:Fatty acid synthase [Eumeta japonica]